MIRVLGIDPALRNTGYAIIEKISPESLNGSGDQYNTSIKLGQKLVSLTYGTIKNNLKLTEAQCLVNIYTKVTELVRIYKPNHLAIESIIYVKNVKTAITMGSVKAAVIIGATKKQSIETTEYSPTKVKLAVTGNGSSNKDQACYMVKSILNISENPTYDESDALAIAITHLNSLKHNLIA